MIRLYWTVMNILQCLYNVSGSSEMVIVGLVKSLGTSTCRFENCTHFILVLRRKPSFLAILLLELLTEKFLEPCQRRRPRAPNTARAAILPRSVTLTAEIGKRVDIQSWIHFRFLPLALPANRMTVSALLFHLASTCESEAKPGFWRMGWSSDSIY